MQLLKKSVAAIIILSLIFHFALVAEPISASNSVKPLENPDYKPGEILVKFKPTNEKTKKEIKADAGGQKTLEKIGAGSQKTELVKLKPGVTVEKALDELNDNKLVESAEPNYKLKQDVLPTDPLFSNQWGLNNSGQLIKGIAGQAGADIDLPEALDVKGVNSNPVIVAVIDTGIDLDHPDLKNQLWINPAEIAGNNIDDDKNGYVDDINGYNFVAGTSSPRDDNGHGTHVSGIVAAQTNNGIGISGTCSSAKIMSLKAGSSQGYLYISDIIEAMYYAADNGAKVVNMSFGGGAKNTLFEDALNYAHSKGVLLFASSGNSYSSSIQYPTAYDNVIGVGATTNTDQKATFSTYNEYVDVSAPGQYVYSTMPTYSVTLSSYGYSYGFLSGTSMASPMAAGVGALILSVHPDFSPQKVQLIMENFTDDLGQAGRDDYFGYGRVNALRAVNGSSHSPLIDRIGPKSVEENQNISFSITASDPDDDLLTYSASQLPTGASFDENTHEFTWKPTHEQIGSHTVKFIVSDGEYNIYENVKVTVNRINNAPVLETISDKYLSNQRSFINFEINATDEDGDKLTYSATNLPQGAYIYYSSSKPYIYWYPNSSQMEKSFTVRINVSDGLATDFQDVVLSAVAINSPPSLTYIPDKTIGSKKANLFFRLSANDVDGDYLKYSVTNLPQGANFNDYGSFSWSKNYINPGVYKVRFSVSDGVATDYQDMFITVVDNNKPPVLKEIGSKTVSKGSYLNFYIYANDADGDYLSYSAQNLPPGARFNSGYFYLNSKNTPEGAYMVRFSASDGTDTDYKDVLITVTKNDGSAPGKSVPYAPNVYSSTHTLGDKYYSKKNNLALSWGFSGTNKYSFALNKSSSYLLDKNNKQSISKANYNKLCNGRWYFHVAAVNVNDDWSKTATLPINIDNYRPKVSALSKVVINYGGIARLKYKVSDPYTGGKANVSIAIKKGSYFAGYINLGLVKINKVSTYKLKSNLLKGNYKYYVYAYDQAGNMQRKIAGNSFVVK